jgi:hypothetical protein
MKKLTSAFNKIGDGTIVSSFFLSREIAGRELIFTSVVSDTFTAIAFARARFIGAIAMLQIFAFQIASHLFSPNCLQTIKNTLAFSNRQGGYCHA